MEWYIKFKNGHIQKGVKVPKLFYNHVLSKRKREMSELCKYYLSKYSDYITVNNVDEGFGLFYMLVGNEEIKDGNINAPAFMEDAFISTLKTTM